MRVLNTTQMREADRLTIEEIGVPSMVLMENAGRQVVVAVEGRFSNLTEQRVALLCGLGSNGGDGFVVARTLKQRGVESAVFVIGSISEIEGDARRNLEILGQLGMPVVEIADEQSWELHYSELSGFDIIIDAILGTGIRPPLVGLLQTLAADINELEIPVVSVDLPSGLSADSHDVPGEAIEATLTVTLGVPKLPLVLPPAELHAGDVVVGDIGIPSQVIDGLTGPQVRIITPEGVRDLIGSRKAESHKGDFGHVLLVAGSVGKSGAAGLAGIGAVKSGAGLVTVATPRSCQSVVAGYAPEYITESLQETSDGCIDSSALEQVLRLSADIIAVGPGLGQGPSVAKLIDGLLERSRVPLVLDADALNVCASNENLLHGKNGLDVIVTPHPGEMARLQGTSVEDVQANRIEAARSLAVDRSVYVVLKGHRTVVACPNSNVFINLTGNPGMATGGSGDVLTGMIAAWSAQLVDTEAGCKVGVYLHGLAGDLAEDDEGEAAMTAVDITQYLGAAVLGLTADQGGELQE
ncbi:uncharacterized protein METZ01_LOCUS38494 [marine metagenome]|uniref:Nicotinamide nucleotide repair protein n=1 Tax=marine metagenome TaxID=408172 RepID=A0A381R2C4_9ZZZZ|tara:strand:- start:2038 stop:3612 length:1575 start_codon:yes stop_codon:yes gene_type:complete